MRTRLSFAIVFAYAGIARADLRVAFDNDIFARFDPHDDDGFTNDIDIRFWRPLAGYNIGGRLFDRWVTEEPRVAGHRRDLIELVASGERSWGDGPARLLTLGMRAGPVFTGNLGGRWMQNAFHITCHCGASLDEGLQSQYQGGQDAGVMAGGTARGSIGLPWLQAYGVADTQAAAGTGVTFVDVAAGGSAIGRFGPTEVGFHFELALMRFHVVDDQGLGMPGGYRPGWQTGYRTGVYVAHAWLRVEYEMHSNEGGSGSPIGLVAFTFKQAGTSF
jgi:hypothetical protein